MATKRSRAKWKTRRDIYGFADGITCGRWTILHLSCGTTRNEAMVEQVVDILKASGIVLEVPRGK